MKLKSLITTLAVAVGLTTAAVGATTTYTWQKWCEDTSYTSSSLSGNGNGLRAGQEKKFAFKANLDATDMLGAKMFYWDGDGNDITLTCTAEGKAYLDLERTKTSHDHVTATSEATISAGEHVFAIYVSRGTSGSGHAAYICVYMDGTELVKVTGKNFDSDPMRYAYMGDSSKSGNKYTAYHVAQGTAIADPSSAMPTIAADAAILFPTLTDHTATVSANTDWSAIEWTPAIEDPTLARLALTVEGGAVITMDNAYSYAEINVSGDATFAAADSFYVDGCFQTNLLTGTVTATGTISSEIKSGYKGKIAQSSSGLTLYAQNREVISINIGGGKSTASTSEAANLVSGSDYYGLYPVPGDSWNNISGRWQSKNTVTLSSAKSYDGATTEIRSSIKLSGTSKNTWQCDSISNPFLRGYFDDGGDGITVEVTGVPYTKYDVIVYVTSDDAQYKLRPLQINGTWYTYDSNGQLVESTGEHGYDGDEWGAGAVKTPTIGQNAILITDVEGSTLTVHGYRPTSGNNGVGGRATVCAVQFINQGELASKDFTANLTESTTWDNGTGAGLADKSGIWENGALNTITLTNTAENATLTLNGEITAASLKIVCAEGKTLHLAKADGATLDIGGYNMTEAAGDVIFDFDPDFTKVDAGSNMVGIGYDYTGTIQSGFKYLGANNTLTMATISSGNVVILGGGTLKGDIDVYGGATVTMGGTYTSPDNDVKLACSKGTLTIAEGADISVTSICLVNSGDSGNDGDLFVNGTLTVTSECGSTVYGSHGNHKGILFGHYYGRSDVTVGATGSLIAENSWIQMTYTANSSLTIDGGTVKVLGINIGSKDNTPITVQNGGTLALKEGLVSQNRGVYTFEGATLKAWSAGFDWTPNTTTFTGDCTVDPDGNTIKLSGAITGSGTLTIKNGVSMTGDLSSYTGTIVVAEDLATLDLGTMRPTNTFKFNGATVVKYTEIIAEDGVMPADLTLAEGSETPTYKMFGVDGTEKEVTEGKYTPTVTGKAALWAWEFNGSLASTGVNTGSMGVDNGQLYTDENDGIYAYSQPYNGLTWTTEFTTAIACTLPTNANVCLVGWGQASPGGIALTSGDVTKNEVKMVYWQNNTAYTTLATMTVPNASTCEHLYLLTKTADSVKVYLDGSPVVNYTGALSLGVGVQVGTVFQGVGKTGLVRLDSVYSGTNDCKAVVNSLRIYDTVLGANAMAKLVKEFPYESPNGTFTRTLEGTDNAWVATDAWTKVGDEEKYDAPTAESTVNLTAADAATVTLNLEESIDFEAMNLTGDGLITISAADANANKISCSGTATIGANAVIKYSAMSLASTPITIAPGKTLTIDASMIDLTKYFASTAITLTGLVTADEVANQLKCTCPTSVSGRSAAFAKNESNNTYELRITVEDHPFVYDNGAWTWGETTVDEATVSNNTAVAIVVQSDLAWNIDRDAITVSNGTLTVAAVTKRAADVTVEAGAVLDVNGNQVKEMALTLNGGKVTNGGANPGEADQIKTLTLTSDSEIETPVKGQIYAASYAAATTIALDEYTLTKTGTAQLQVVNIDITGSGTIYVKEGEFYGSEDTRAAGVTFKVGADGTLHNRGGKTMTLAKIIGEGGTLNNEGTMSGFELEGTLTIANAGEFDTITNAAEAVVNVGTKRGLTFAGAGTVNVTLTDAEIAAEGPITIFETEEGATTQGGTVVDKDGNAVPGSFTGGAFQISHEAKNGTTYYLTLADALSAAQADETVTLLKDITLDATLTLDKAITLDLGNKTVTLPTAGDGITVTANATVKNGTLTSQLTANTAVYALHSYKTSATYEDLVINGANYRFVVYAEGADTIAACYGENDPTTTVNCKNVDVTGNGTLFEAEFTTMNLDADCSGIVEGTPWNYAAAIYSAGNATITIAGGAYTNTLALLSGNLGGSIIVNGGAFGGDIKSWMESDKHTEYHSDPKFKANFMFNAGTYNGAIVFEDSSDAARELDSFSKLLKVAIDAPEGYEWKNFAATQYYHLTKKSDTPSIPESQGAITPVEGKENTYAVSNTTDTVDISNLPAGATIVLDPSVTYLSGMAENTTVKIVAESTNTTENVVDITGAFKVLDGTGTTATIELDKDGEVTIDGETIPVTPTMTMAEASAGTIADGAVATKAIPGLTYTLVRDGNVGGTYIDVADTDTAKGTTVTLKDETGTKPTDKAFYKIQVTK